jgi:hypothetical protein
MIAGASPATHSAVVAALSVSTTAALACVHTACRAGLSKAAMVELATRTPEPFHAIDSRPVWWTGSEACDGRPASASDRDYASGLVSSLIITALVTDSAAWGAGCAVYLDIQPARADCNRVAPGEAASQRRRG